MPAMPRRRAKAFTDGRQRPLDRNLRARLMHLAKAARRARTITRASVDILEALIFTFANLRDGRCIPGYRRLALAAGCAMSTVALCLPLLERAGLLVWRHRLRRVREYVPGLFGQASASRWRVVRSSNSYSFPGFESSETDFQSGTTQEIYPSTLFDTESPLGASLERLRSACGAKEEALRGV